MPTQKNDNLTAAGAEDLCRTLAQYWQDRGRHDVEFHTEVEMRPVKTGTDVSLHVVRSNLKLAVPKSPRQASR